jgi:hypothetical protein
MQLCQKKGKETWDGKGEPERVVEQDLFLLNEEEGLETLQIQQGI